MRRCQCPTRRQHGATIVEVAVAAVVLLMLILAIIDFGRMHFYRSRLQYAVSQAARFATLGQTIEDPENPGRQLTRDDAIAYLVRSLAQLPKLSEADITIRSTDALGRTSEGAGGPGDIVLVEARYTVDLLAPLLAPAFPGGVYQFTVRTRFRNEEFGPAQT